jgi:hypothetical protein
MVASQPPVAFAADPVGLVDSIFVKISYLL